MVNVRQFALLCWVSPIEGGKERNPMRSFVTGSRKYGKPNEKSDIDLVVWVSPTDLHLLQAMADKENGIQESTKIGVKETSSDGGPEADSLRFGKLNLIAVTWKDAFEAWKKGTEELIERSFKKGRSIERYEAIQLFKKLRKELAKRESHN